MWEYSLPSLLGLMICLKTALGGCNGEVGGKQQRHRASIRNDDEDNSVKHKKRKERARTRIMETGSITDSQDQIQNKHKSGQQRAAEGTMSTKCDNWKRGTDHHVVSASTQKEEDKRHISKPLREGWLIGFMRTPEPNQRLGFPQHYFSPLPIHSPSFRNRYLPGQVDPQHHLCCWPSRHPQCSQAIAMCLTR